MSSKLCICKICTCGQHKCPHRPLGIVGKSGPCPVTEYKNEYKAFEGNRRQLIKPDSDYRPSDIPMADTTTNKNDYIRHQVNRVSVHQPDTYRPPSGEMNTMTSYNQEYQNKGGRPAQAVRRSAGPRTTAQFEGNPTYKNDFRQWDLTKTQPIRKDNGYTPSNEKFAGDSTYVGDFQKHQQAPRAPIRPDQRAIMSNEPFHDKTSNREDYRKFEVQPMYKKPKEPVAVNNAPMDNMTTNRRDYTTKEIDPIKSYKPDGQGYRSDAPFDDATTNKNDYKKWGVQPMHAKRDQTWVAPLGEMDLKTNYNSDFTAKPNQRPMAIRPAQRVMVDAKFDGDSTYGQDFRQWGPEKRALAKAPAEYKASGIPFDGQSTYKNHFVGDRGGAAVSFKPDSMAYRSHDPFNADTSYRTEYVKKELEKCPSELLDSKFSNFTFVTADPQTGHKFYAPNNNGNPVYAQ